MKMYIVGTGGVGGYLGRVLAKAGNDITFVARGDNYKKIKKDGLKVSAVKFGDFTIRPAKIISIISQIRNPDLIFVTVKTYDTLDVARELGKVTTPRTTIITFQNGIQNDYEIKKYVKKGKVYPGLAYIVTRRIEPGLIEQVSGLGEFIFGDRKNNKNTNLKDVERIMLDAGIVTKFSDDIERDVWKKYIFICAMTGLSALVRCTVGRVVTDSILRSIYERALREGINVAKAEGVKLPKNIFESTIKVSEDTNKSAKFSMLVDIERGSKIEIEALNGALVRLARKHKIDVPINETIYGALRLLEPVSYEEKRNR